MTTGQRELRSQLRSINLVGHSRNLVHAERINRQLAATILAIAGILTVGPFVLPSESALSAPNAIFAIVLVLMVSNLTRLRIPRLGLALLAVAFIPSLLIIELLPLTIVPIQVPFKELSFTTVLKQLRDPATSWMLLVVLIGHSKAIRWQLLVTRTAYSFALLGAVTAGIYLFGKTQGVASVLANPRGFMAGFEGPNSLAAALALLLPLSITLLAGNSSTAGKIAAFLCVSIFSVMLFLTGSRGALVALLSGLLVVILAILLDKSSRYSMHRAIWLFPLVTIVCAIAISIPGGPLARLVNTDWQNLTSDLTTSRRAIQLETAWQLFQERPVFGHGLGGFEIGYTHKHPGITTSTTPHNALMFAAVQGGVLGTSLLMAYYSLLMAIGWRAFTRLSAPWKYFGLYVPPAIIVLDLFFPYTRTYDTGLLAVICLSILLFQTNVHNEMRITSAQQPT